MLSLVEISRTCAEMDIVYRPVEQTPVNHHRSWAQHIAKN